MDPKLDMMAQDKPHPEEAGNALSSSTLIPDSQLEKQVLRKLDLRLAPLFATLYFVAYLDRSNIGNAAVAGLTEDLGLSGSQFSTAVSVFFATQVFEWKEVFNAFKDPKVYSTQLLFLETSGGFEERPGIRYFACYLIAIPLYCGPGLNEIYELTLVVRDQ
ncbi:hypothetical protein KHU50_010922 [Colletotrichum sp. SAR 10_65]|nr:hypothetical protein KHU50_010922 [Colletotrichum sp. SAR 10_65]